MKLLVHYDHRSGEDEAGCEVLMQGNGKPEKIIHSKFKDFWAETSTEEKGRIYVNKGGYPAVKIRGWDEVPDKDWLILKKYLTEI